MAVEMTKEELLSAQDIDLGGGEWQTIEQKNIDLFADATGDHQWIHVDQEAAKQGPFGTTVAHGYLSLSLLPALLPELLTVTDATMGINYGIDKVRFTAPIPSGSKVRVKATLRESQSRGDGILYKVGIEMELEGSEKPALVGDVLYMVF
jgi:acyl dehydratase